MALKTNYTNDILDTTKNTERKYNIKSSSGTIVNEGVTFEDVTEYTSEGDRFGASDINAITTRVNQLTASDGLDFKFATDGEGNYGYLGADDSFIPFRVGGMPIEFLSGYGMDFSLFVANGNKGGELFKFTTNATIHFSGEMYMLDYCNMWLDHKRNGTTIQNLATWTGTNNKDRFKNITFEYTIEVKEGDTLSFTTSTSSTSSSSASLNQFRIKVLEIV